MSDIQNIKKVAVKGCKEEVIKSNLIPIDILIASELIKAESKIKRLIRLKQTEFNLLFLLLSIAEPMNLSKLKKIICLGYSVFYRDVNSLQKKGLINSYREGSKIMYYSTFKAWEEFSSFYPSFKFRKPKIDQ